MTVHVDASLQAENYQLQLKLKGMEMQVMKERMAKIEAEAELQKERAGDRQTPTA